MVHIVPISMCHYYVRSFCRRSFDDAKQELMQLKIKRVTLHIDVLAMQKCNLLLENELLSMRQQAMYANRIQGQGYGGGQGRPAGGVTCALRCNTAHYIMLFILLC